MTWVPIARPSMLTSIWAGRWVASASMLTDVRSWASMPSDTTSPTTASGTSMVTFSPRRTATRSTCSYMFLMGCRWIAFGMTSCSSPSMSRVSSTFTPPWRIALAKPRSGSDTCRTSAPWP